MTNMKVRMTACCEIPKMWLWLALWSIAFSLGSVGVMQRISFGHKLAAYGNYVTWGLYVGVYIYFVGLSAGAFMLSSLVYVFGIKKFERIGHIALIVALITLLMALLTIWFDLGHMERFYFVFIRPNFHSMMAWMVWLYTGYSLLLASELWLALRVTEAAQVLRPVLMPLPQFQILWRPVLASATFLFFLVVIPFVWMKRQTVLALWATPTMMVGWDWVIMSGFFVIGLSIFLSVRKLEIHRALRVLGTLGVPLAIAFHGGVGALFATAAARPYWHSPIYPILFLTGALVSGGALLTAIVAFLYPMPEEERNELTVLMGRIVAGLLLFDLMLEWSEFSVHLWYGFGETVETLKLILFGPFWWVFWIVHLLIGSLIPLVLILGSRKPKVIGFGSLLIVITFMAVRLNLVIPGLATPQIKGLEEAFFGPRFRLDYVPSLHEWLVVLFVVSLGIGLFFVSCKMLHKFQPHQVGTAQ